MQELDTENNPYSNPYAAPQSQIIGPPPVAQQDELADRGVRLAAYLIDLAFSIAAIAPGGVVFFMGMKNSPRVNDMDTTSIIGICLLLLGFTAYAVYNCILLYQNGQTLGKKLMQIKIVRADGYPSSLLRILFLRGLPVGILNAIPLIGYVFTLLDPLMIFRADQRCLHDLIADTIVIKA